MMGGCGKEADSTEVNTTEVQSTVEEMSSTAVSEVASETAPTEIATEPVAQTASPDEDEAYNYGMLCGLGVNQNDAKVAVAYLSGISYGRIISTEWIELSNHAYIELKNNEAVVLYLYMTSDNRIKEITDINLYTLITISGDVTSDASQTQTDNGRSTGAYTDDSNSSTSQSSNGSSAPFDLSAGEPNYAPSGFFEQGSYQPQ